MIEYDKYFLANRDLWNKRTAIHKDSGFYDVAGFKKGQNSLTQIELSELGDVNGKKMLHLQCHFGLDSLSWSRMGADVTGIDFSDEAIKEAKKLNDEVGLQAKFFCCNVYDLHPASMESSKFLPFRHRNAPAHAVGEDLGGSFDIVFTSYGVIGWLPDLKKWAEIIFHYLKPGGTFYMAEFHPVIWMFDDNFKEIKYCYENREIIETETQGTYTDQNANIKEKEYGWNHSISEVLNALITHGMQIEFFNEHMYSPYNCFNNSVQNKEGNWWIKGLEDKIPMVYSLKAIRPY